VKSQPHARFLSEAEYPRWSGLVRESPEGSIYSMPEYLDVLCAATGGRFRVLAVERGGELLGGAALYEERSRLGPVVGPRLLLTYNGVVSAHCDSQYPSQCTGRYLETLAALLPALAGAGYARLTLKCRAPFADARPFLQAGWFVRPSYTYVVHLADLDAAWKRVEQNLRRLVKRCEQEGLAITEDQDFDSYYRMHRSIHERKGMKLYLPERRFRAYVESLQSRGLGRLFHARLATGRSVAAQLVLTGGHPVTHTVTAASDPEFLRLGASAFLRWKVFGELARGGFEGNDLTDASLNAVTHFKAQLGGDLEMCLVLKRPDPPKVRLFDVANKLRRGRL
jgi:hypothetical protein